MTYEELGRMLYSEFDFRSNFICEQQAKEEKKRLIAASFTAWQIGSFNGLKKSWNEYLSMIGLSENSKIDSYTKNSTNETIKRIKEKLNKK